MVHEIKATDRTGSRLQLVTSLLIVSFCFFKTERYIHAHAAIDDPSRPVVELVTRHLPRHTPPQLFIDAPPSGPRSTSTSPDAYGGGAIFRILHREYTHLIAVRIPHFQRESIPVPCTFQQCRRHFSLPDRSDDPPAFSRS